jgi:hypothetical protein
LEGVSRGEGTGLFLDSALINGVLDVSDDQLCAEFLHKPVSELNRFREVVAGVDVKKRKGDGAGGEGLSTEMNEDDRVFSAAEEKGGALKLAGDLSQGVNGFVLQCLKVEGKGY